MIYRATRTAAPFHRTRIFFQHLDHVFHGLDRRVGRHHKHVVFVKQTRNRRGLSERDRWLVLHDGTHHHRPRNDHRVAVAFARVNELRKADGAAGTAFVFELGAFRHARLDHRFTEAATGLIKAATGVGTNHEFNVFERERAAREQSRGAQRKQGLA